MKKVLILAYDFLPLHSIAAQRPASWLKYFKEFDIYPVVVTMHWDNDIRNERHYAIPSFREDISDERVPGGRIVRVPFKANRRDHMYYMHGEKFSVSRKILSLYYLFARYLDLSKDSTREIYNTADKLLSEESFDCILITAEPFILFKYGHLLSGKHNIPWIADYRDCWSITPAAQYNSLDQKLIQRIFYKNLEKKYVSTASRITCPSPSYKKLISKVNNLPVDVVYNGFDLEGTNGLLDRSQNSDVFEIAYGGRIYPHQNLEIFLKGYLTFINKYKVYNTRAVFYGLDFYPENKSRLFSFSPDLAAYLDTTPRLPYETLLNKLADSNVLLLLSNKNADWLNAKVFDYLPLNRRILLTTSDRGILQNILDETKSGVGVETADEVCDFLYQAYKEFESSGRVQAESQNYDFYSRKKQASVLAKILHECVA